MKPAVELEIAELGLLGWPSEALGPRVPALLERALSLVAERLARSPWGRAEVRELALERLELDTIPIDELLGPRGAERLADELYSALTRSMR